MPARHLNPNGLAANEDWEGNNAAFTCPLCSKVFIVTDNPVVAASHDAKGVRRCPQCGKSIGRVSGGKLSGGTASIEW
jgi:predicted RNA-binding Zn-ribbon protein involved in translation (DUF1610 family)